MRGRERMDAMISAALIAGGLIAILDNVVAHWILQLHRAIPGPHPEPVEAAVVELLGSAGDRRLAGAASARRLSRCLGSTVRICPAQLRDVLPLPGTRRPKR